MNTENNILLAEFLEFQKTDLGWFDNEGVLSEVEQDNCFDSLYFDTDWNWLMAVVDKIESLLFENDNSVNVTIGSSCYCVIQDSLGNLLEITKEENSKIASVYKACVEFIQWYNKENNEK